MRFNMSEYLFEKWSVFACKTKIYAKYIVIMSKKTDQHDSRRNDDVSEEKIQVGTEGHDPSANLPT